MTRNGSTRRDALKLVGAAAGTSTLSGIAAGADNEKREVNVGWADDHGRSKAQGAADEVIRSSPSTR